MKHINCLAVFMVVFYVSGYSQSECNDKILKKIEQSKKEEGKTPFHIFQKGDNPDYYKTIFYTYYALYSRVNIDSSLHYLSKDLSVSPPYLSDIGFLGNYWLKRMPLSVKRRNDIEKLLNERFDEKVGNKPNKEFLKEMYIIKDADQSVRQYISICPDNQAYKDLAQIDSTNLVKIKKLYAQNGLPKISEFPESIIKSFYLIVIHSGRDTTFQEQVLAAMKKLSKKEYPLNYYALLTDKIMVAKTGKQLYGTQFKDMEGKYLYPIINENSVNERRVQMGLKPIEKYAKTVHFLNDN